MGNMTTVAQFQNLSTARQCEWIDRLFARLSAMYGSKFVAMWEGFDMAGVKSVWMEDLAEFSTAEISTGVSACKARDWPPTLPEFIKLCRPSVDYERAFLEASEQLALRERGRDGWAFPALYWAAQSMSYEMRNKSYNECSKRWQKALDDAIYGVRSGKLSDSVPEKRDALPPPGRTTPDRETVMANLEKINSMLGSVADSLKIKD